MSNYANKDIKMTQKTFKTALKVKKKTHPYRKWLLKL